MEEYYIVLPVTTEKGEEGFRREIRYAKLVRTAVMPRVGESILLDSAFSDGVNSAFRVEELIHFESESTRVLVLEPFDACDVEADEVTEYLAAIERELTPKGWVRYDSGDYPGSVE